MRLTLTVAVLCCTTLSVVDVIGTFDESGLRESEFGIYAAGTFRIEGEGGEGKA
jgi:hypothetical protein